MVRHALMAAETMPYTTDLLMLVSRQETHSVTKIRDQYDDRHATVAIPQWPSSTECSAPGDAIVAAGAMALLLPTLRR